MDYEKKSDMDPQSHVLEDLNNGLNEKEQENQSFDANSEKREVIESNENDSLLSREKEPEALESVYKYTSRIKSFLGWDSDNVDSEIVKDLDELVDEKNAFDQNIDNNSKPKEMDKILPSLTEVSNGPDMKKIDFAQNGEEFKRDNARNELQGADHFPENDKNMQFQNTSDIPTSDSFTPVTTANVDYKDISSPNELQEIDHLHEKDENMQTFSPGIHGNADQKDIIIPEKSIPVEESQDSEYSTEKETLNGINRSPVENELKENMSEDVLQNKNAILPDIEDTVGREGEEIIFKTHSGNNLDESGNENFKDTSKENVFVSDSSAKDTNLNDNESSDKEYLDENAATKKKVRNPHLEDIKRLSLDIVKDVIDSARSSIHEIFLNKSEENKTENLQIDESSRDNLINCEGKFFKEKYIDTVNLHRNNLEYSNIDTKTVTPDLDKSFDSVFYEKETNIHIPFDYKENISQERKPSKDPESFMDPDTICGFGCFKPKCIQKWATPRAFLIFFSMLGVIHGTYYTYMVGIISTLEKRYAFPTKVSGTLLIADEIIPLLGMLVGYFGSKTHRPRMTALGMLMGVACCFITALPYFIYGSAKHVKIQNTENNTNLQYCDVERKQTSCNKEFESLSVTVVVLLIIASLLKGFGALAFHIMGISYMDDNTPKKNTPIFLAISLALRLLGPLVGYLMSFVFLKMYENPLEDPGFGPEDPRWIGAWWLGFCVQGVLLLIFTIPIALFPRRMPGQKKPDQTKDETMKEMFSGLCAAIKRLAKNPVYIFLAINTVLTIFGHFGHLIMLPKYMENQFRLSASDASLFSGVTSISCIMVSTVLGGFLIWKFKPTAKVLLGGMVASEILLVLGFLLLTIPRCQEVEMSHYGINNDGLILDSVCNVNCNCSTISFTPFCGPDGKTTYFSPCHAGCTLQLNSSMLPKRQKEFGNCSCVVDVTGTSGDKITEGLCQDENCWNQTIVFIIILLVMLTICNTFSVAHTIILLRSVHPNDKSFALGTFETFICLFGFIPGPVIYGALVDSSCLVWEKSCDQTGNCWFYDMGRYNYSMHVASSVFCGLATICLIVLYFLNSRVRSLYSDELDEPEYVDIKLDTVSGSVTKL